MSQLPIQLPVPSLLIKLRSLLRRAPQPAQSTLSLHFQAACPKIAEIYTPINAEEVLLDLIDKASTSQTRKNWKYDETSYLIYIIDRYSQVAQVNSKHLDRCDWEQIAGYMPGRTADNCRFRYLSLAPSSITDTPWGVEERQLLIKIIQSQQSHNINWKVVSQKLYQLSPNKIYRTGKQCREHYTCFLRPNLKKGPWTDAEDYQLICLFMNYGKKWSKMAKFIEGRNENSIKNRFFLMFENRKQGKLTNSDLTKQVKRKKEKLEKKMAKSQEQQTIQQNLTSSINQSPSQREQLPLDQPIEHPEDEPLNIFDNYQSVFSSEGLKEWVTAKKDTFLGTSSEEIEKYINF